MAGWRRADGQAAAELVALLPILLGVLACAWQLVLLGHATLAAGTAAHAAAPARALGLDAPGPAPPPPPAPAAHAAARARALGLDAPAAARAPLPARLEHGLRVHARPDGGVQVAVRIPTLPGIPPLGRVEATARFDPQT